MVVAYHIGNSSSCTEITLPTEANATAHSPDENVQSMIGLYRLETRHWLLLKTTVATIQDTLTTIQVAPRATSMTITSP